MSDTIAWEKVFDRAQERAQKENLPILLFFHNPD
jgi:hypothetical protein